MWTLSLWACWELQGWVWLVRAGAAPGALRQRGGCLWVTVSLNKRSPPSQNLLELR